MNVWRGKGGGGTNKGSESVQAACRVAVMILNIKISELISASKTAPL
jgi:hypothetical protein